MRFDGLLWECLLPGKYEHTEQGLTAVLEPLPGESVLLFETDRPAFRYPNVAQRISDLMYFYRGPAGKDSPTLLFVELKGSDYQHAEEQLTNAIKAVLDKLDQRYREKGKERVRLVAIVILGSSAPHDAKKRMKDLYQATGAVFRYRSNARMKRTDLRQHLTDTA